MLCYGKIRKTEYYKFRMSEFGTDDRSLLLRKEYSERKGEYVTKAKEEKRRNGPQNIDM